MHLVDLALELDRIGESARLELCGDRSIHRLEREGALLPLAEGAQLEVVGRVERGADGHLGEWG